MNATYRTPCQADALFANPIAALHTRVKGIPAREALG
jgi:hypothetical protein